VIDRHAKPVTSNHWSKLSYWKCISRLKNWKKNREKSHLILTPNKLDLTIRAPNHCVKFHQNQIKIAAVGVLINRVTEW